MKCPSCENELTQRKASGIQANICQNSCGGFWFHISQIRKLEHVKPGAGYDLLTVEIADGVKTYRDSVHPCPQCKTTLLYRHFFSRKYDTEVNQCAKCSGFWIDAGGLAKIVQLKNKEKKMRLEEYFTVIMDEKISGMNLASPDLAESAKMITQIFKFLKPEL